LPSERPRRRLLDIIENGERIQTYVAGLDESAFSEGFLVGHAVERCLERIREEVVKLGKASFAHWETF
jgi:uncharacterized protein with HEPN domain